jgi:hypothetical protein
VEPCRREVRSVSARQWRIRDRQRGVTLLAGLGVPGVHELHFSVPEEGSTAVAYVVLSVSAGEW